MWLDSAFDGLARFWGKIKQRLANLVQISLTTITTQNGESKSSFVACHPDIVILEAPRLF